MHALPLLILLLSTLPLYGHSGAVAVAVPIAGITLDGDLSDWPEGMQTVGEGNPECRQLERVKSISR